MAPTSDPRPALVRVLIAESSALLVRLYVQAISEAGGFHIIATAADGPAALAMTKEHRPDVLLLSNELARTMGASAIVQELMTTHPTATIVIGNNLTAGSATSKALFDLGAVDCIAKPEFHMLSTSPLVAVSEAIVPVLRRAGRIKVVRLLTPGSARTPLPISIPTPRPTTMESSDSRTRITPLLRTGSPVRAIIIGSSTGGPDALRRVLKTLPKDLPVPILIAQHMPEGFTEDLARHLTSETGHNVREVCDGETIRAGTIYLGSGGKHFRVKGIGMGSAVLSMPMTKDENCPSVNLLFKTAATVYGGALLAVVLTGMGEDGAAGVKTVKAEGGRVIVQDEATSLIYGMPGSAVETGCVDLILPVDAIGAVLGEATLATTAGSA